MSKYFSYDALDGELYFHDNEQEAKQFALKMAEDGYECGSEWDGSFPDETQDQIRNICYGVILGGIDLPTRQPSIEEDGEGTVEEFDYIVQPPVIVEYEQKLQSWIKCSDKMPPFGIDILFYVPSFSNGVLTGKLISEDRIGQRFYSANIGFFPDSVTHWRPLPPPPTDIGCYL